MTTTTRKLGMTARETPNFFYFGEREDWERWLGKHRDSNTLDSVNFDVACEALAEVGEKNEDWAVESSSHWAVGWIECIVLLPGSPAHAKACELQDRLDGYPILDKDRFWQQQSRNEQDWLEDELSNRLDDPEQVQAAMSRYDDLTRESSTYDSWDEGDWNILEQVLSEYQTEEEES